MKGYIYSIRSHQTKDIYIGSTGQHLSARMGSHRREYKNMLNGSKQRISSSIEILKYEDAYIELIIEVEVKSRQELFRIEGEYIRTMNCVNKQIAGRIRKERDQENKEHNTEMRKQHYENNKEHNKKISKIYADNHKEEKKQNHIDHKEERNKRCNQRYQDNKVIIREQQKQKFTCICGAICSISSKYNHTKSKKHNLYVATNPVIQVFTTKIQ
jgi:hypothetical protein